MPKVPFQGCLKYKTTIPHLVMIIHNIAKRTGKEITIAQYVERATELLNHKTCIPQLRRKKLKNK